MWTQGTQIDSGTIDSTQQLPGQRESLSVLQGKLTQLPEATGLGKAHAGSEGRVGIGDPLAPGACILRFWTLAESQ